ncbi:MAG: hypothetical protein IIA53_07550, partial [Chloroflexi bacterium]|nr:hypothetical protein [Chloroflexota bacterium]
MFQIPHPNQRVTVVSRDFKLAATRGDDKGIHLWDLETGKEIRHFKGKAEGRERTPLAFSPDGSKLASIGWDAQNMQDGTKRISFRWSVWDVKSGRLESQIKDLNPGPTRAVFFNDGKCLFWGISSASVIAYDAGSGKKRLEIPLKMKARHR